MGKLHDDEDGEEGVYSRQSVNGTRGPKSIFHFIPQVTHTYEKTHLTSQQV
jgi:hypothetical protein